MNKFDFELHVN